MGKSFKVWLDDTAFKDWLKPVMGNDREAFCSVIKSHRASTVYQQRIRARGEQLPVSCFGATQSSETANTSSATSTSIADTTEVWCPISTCVSQAH